ncbi:MAG TPA: DUF1552 domain-containing protein [Gemmataceae bacterium]|jgi:hypothetical protein|nr:DUF1552 domain-containing protein [Gemmataceae bacterium]
MKLCRRNFLRAAGVSLALPWLDALAPARALAAAAAPRRRMVCICTPLGLHPPHFFPERAGRNYPLTPYLEVLKDFRDDFTVLSGLSHPEVDQGHDSAFTFLTAASHPENRAGFRNTISLDQFAVERVGLETRFPSLTLGDEGFGLSWTRSGAPVPADFSPSRVFARLFLEGRPEEVQAQARRLRAGQSVLDAVGDQARKMQAGLGANDRDKLDEYFTSVRELEQRLARAEEWSKKPKPRVEAKQPQDIPNSSDLVGRTRLLFDLAHLALQTDSTRLITIFLLGTSQVPPIAGVALGHHDLSHHGQDPSKIEQLKKVELETMKVLRDLLAKLKQTKEEGVSLLERTMVLFGSNLGNANNHSCKNLPIILAGGGFKHGQHLAFDPAKPPPLCNLYVTMLQRLDIEADRFGSSTGTLTGLETTG